MRLTKGGNGEGYRYDRELEEGTFDAVVLSAVETVSKNGNEMIAITFGIDGPLGGVRIDHYVVAFLDHRIEELLQALAPEHFQDWQEHGACELEPEELQQRTCRATISHEAWNGRLRPRIRALYPLAACPTETPPF